MQLGSDLLPCLERVSGEIRRRLGALVGVGSLVGKRLLPGLPRSTPRGYWHVRPVGPRTSTRLDAGVEASGPHDFAVRFSAVRLRAV
jgi:hypothetical protein